jgi:putative ABC transport system permease protein
MMCGPIFRGVRMLVVSIAPDSIPPIVMSLEPRIALWSVLMSVGISLGVGLLFGLYPARRAAAMNPIEALRHE